MTVGFASIVARMGRIKIQAPAGGREHGPEQRIAPEESRREARRMTAARGGARRWADLQRRPAAPTPPRL